MTLQGILENIGFYVISIGFPLLFLISVGSMIQRAYLKRDGIEGLSE